MAYAINKTDGTVVATVADGTLDTTSSSLSLIGKNYAGYGEVLNENQVKLIENFANTSSNTPTAPLQGQVWYNTTANQLQVYNGSTFKSVSGANVIQRNQQIRHKVIYGMILQIVNYTFIVEQLLY